MNNLPIELIDIIYEYDGRVKKAYSDCLQEIKMIAKQWVMTLSVLKGINHLPIHSKIWLSKCQHFHHFIIDYIRKKIKFK